ncbi:MAG: beta-(1-6) glucans synthase [Proteobacteria bacterium SG_bin9]|nr:MAG: beta-(1-6) glucans synthase [Proteobacteria bacterium SG_bin9]
MVAVWWWIATPVALVRAPIDPAQKLECVSYAPFRGLQSPLDLGVRITPEQIKQDLAQLAQITNCVRTYSVDSGLELIPELAEKAGLKVILGIWLSSDRVKTRQQIQTGIALAKTFPNVITSVVVGNEVLLRGEMTSADLAATIRSVKAQVAPMRVTYADVWEFWLRNRDVYEAVDFVTIHILPYWEDVPVRARHAVMHVDSIRKRMGVAFPNKEILIGETGWPSTGRMREGALPSRTNQARVVAEILELAKREGFRVNLIEAYDQPWKRRLEGTVGGYWGLIGDDPRTLKYPAGKPVSNYPDWQLFMGAGLTFSVIVFGVALVTLRRKPWKPHWSAWLAVFVSATAAGALLGVAFDKFLYESLGYGGWIQNGCLLAAAVLSPLFATHALMAGKGLPAFVELIGPRDERRTLWSCYALGLVLTVVVVIAAASALGFVFDPRYRDFKFASLTMAVLPLAGLMAFNRPKTGARPIAEATFAGLLVAAAIFTLVNEGPKNWQSIWTCGIYLLLGVTLWQARAAQSRG